MASGPASVLPGGGSPRGGPPPACRAVFSIFATLSFIDVKMLGVGLAFAVLLDATIVRGILVPAAMTMLGERCWYMPGRLSWLHGLSFERKPRAAVKVAEALTR